MHSRITIHTYRITYSIKIGPQFTQAFRKSSKIALDLMILIKKVNQLFQRVNAANIHEPVWWTKPAFVY